jgi:hypothetical protein
LGLVALGGPQEAIQNAIKRIWILEVRQVTAARHDAAATTREQSVQLLDTVGWRCAVVLAGQDEYRTPNTREISSSVVPESFKGALGNDGIRLASCDVYDELDKTRFRVRVRRQRAASYGVSKEGSRADCSNPRSDRLRVEDSGYSHTASNEGQRTHFVGSSCGKLLPEPSAH